MSHSREKQQIELATAISFLKEYNRVYGTAYKVKLAGDAPDIRCEDSDGRELNIEITTSDDRDGDIKAALGRSECRSVDALKSHVELVRHGKANPRDGATNLETDVIPRIVKCIKKKLLNDYGTNVALLVYHKTGCNWSWNRVSCCVREQLDLTKSPFDMGIWILDWKGNAEYSIFRVDAEG